MVAARGGLRQMKKLIPWTRAVNDALYLDGPFERQAHAMRIKKGRGKEARENKQVM